MKLRCRGALHRLLMAGALALLLPAAASAQVPARQTLPRDTVAQDTAAQDTVRTPEQRAIDRLRALGRVAAPDTVQQPDSLGGVGVQFESRREPLQSRIQHDSVMTALLGIDGYVATEYMGREARFEADSNRLALQGDAQVTREGTMLMADSTIIYNEQLGRACGYGNPVVQSAQMTNPLASDTVCYLIESRRAFARNARTSIDQGVNWLVRGDLYMVGNDYYSHDAVFTDCDEEHPHYHFGASSLKVVQGNIMVARNVTMNFADVPVFWFPFFIQSMSRGRRSGILMPRFGINDIARTSSRYSRRIEDVGVYWAISENFGAQVSMDWFSNNWTAVNASFDYRFLRQFLNGGLTFRRFWPSDGGREFTVTSRNSWQPNERTQLGLNVDYTTSTAFVRQRTFDPREIDRSVRSDAQVRRTFDFGTLSLGASREQRLSDNTVNSTMPSLNLTVSPITLFEADPGEERWFSNATWNGSLASTVRTREVGAENLTPQAQGSREVQLSADQGLRVGAVNWGVRGSLNDSQRDERVLQDSLGTLVPGSEERRGGVSTSLSFQQRIIGTTSISPSIAVGTDFVRDSRTDGRTITAPLRATLGVTLGGEIYGFYPGVSSFERFRHKLAPNFSYNYSPKSAADSLQQLIFGGAGGLERNTLDIGLSQTFEAKYRSRAEDDEAEGAAGDSLVAGDSAGAPRRRQQANTVILLSIETSAVAYDFVEARDGYGFTSTTLQNSIQSDLLRGLAFTVTHDLFRTPGDTGLPGEGGAGTGGVIGKPPREFAPHLSRLSTNFTIDSNSWLFRLLRIGSSDTTSTSQAAAPLQRGDPMQAGTPVDYTESEYGMIGTSRRTAPGTPAGAPGSWSASVNYDLVRPRKVEGMEGFQPEEDQRVTGDLAFEATPNWSVRWHTGYSFTTSEFSQHILTLTRRLHDWDANFDFVKAQNGNFSFQFRVHLRANPDIKLDYSQNDLQGVRR